MTGKGGESHPCGFPSLYPLSLVGQAACVIEGRDFPLMKEEKEN